MTERISASGFFLAALAPFPVKIAGLSLPGRMNADDDQLVFPFEGHYLARFNQLIQLVWVDMADMIRENDFYFLCHVPSSPFPPFPIAYFNFTIFFKQIANVTIFSCPFPGDCGPVRFMLQ